MALEPRPDLALVPGYHSPQVDVDVRLNTNESPLPPPEKWVEGASRLVADIAWNRYPDREATELRSRLAALHGCAAEQVFVANGSNEVLQCLLLAFGGPGRSAAVFEPTYALHSHIARVTGTRVISARRADDFTLAPDAVTRLIDEESPDLLFLCSPNNPTGMVESPEVVAAALAATSALVVVDEAYGQFAPWTAIDLVGDATDLVVTRTFSKTWSMAAARLGYCVAPRRIVEQLERVALPYHLDAFKQAAGSLALDLVGEMEARVAQIVDERERVVMGLGALPVSVWPSAANFILFRPDGADGGLDGDNDGDSVWHALVARSVLVRNCASWPHLEGCLRVTVGTAAENDAFLTALTEILT